MAAPPGGHSPGLPLDLVAAGHLSGSSQDTRHKPAVSRVCFRDMSLLVVRVVSV